MIEAASCTDERGNETILDIDSLSRTIININRTVSIYCYYSQPSLDYDDNETIRCT